MVHLLIDIAKKANPDRVAVVKANERLLNLLTRLAGEWFEVEYLHEGGSQLPWEVEP